MGYNMELSRTMWRVIFAGVLRDGDLLEMVKEVRALRAEGPIASPNGLVDMTGLSEIILTFETLSSIGTEARGYSLHDKIKIAVITNSPAQFGYARMFQTLLNHGQIDLQVFYEDELAALGWLSK